MTYKETKLKNHRRKLGVRTTDPASDFKLLTSKGDALVTDKGEYIVWQQ